MSRVLVLGAGGLVGFHVARLFAQSGWFVTGVARKPEAIKRLAAAGVNTVQADANEISKYREFLDSAAVIIDAGLVDFAALMAGQDPRHTTREIVKTIKETSAASSVKKRFILTSGAGIYAGSSLPDGSPRVIDEQSPLSENFIAKAVFGFDDELLKEKEVHGTVVRPAAVYGGWFGAWRHLFTAADQKLEQISVPTSDIRLGFVHVEDLARAFLMIAAAPAASVSGEAFLVAGDDRATLRDIWIASARAAGSKAPIVEKPIEEIHPEFGALLKGLNVITSTNKIRNQIGWEPKFKSIFDHLTNLVQQYRASI